MVMPILLPMYYLHLLSCENLLSYINYFFLPKMRHSLTLLIPWILLHITTSFASLDLSAKDNVVLYWLGGDSNSLASYCTESEYPPDVIVISFLNIDYTGSMQQSALLFDLGTDCDGSAASASCSSIASDISTCQDAGVTVMLSMGGETTDMQTIDGITSDEASTLASLIWETFGPVSDASTDLNRPFGSSVINGFDFDVEQGSSSTNTGITYLANALIELMDAESEKFYISAAPQCPLLDNAVYYMAEFLADVTRVDMILIQFYNNAGCSANTGINWSTWTGTVYDTLAYQSAKLFVGLPASPSANGTSGGYIVLDDVKKLLTETIVPDADKFAGIMLWDAADAYANTENNLGYNQNVKSILEGVFESSSSSSISSSSTSSTSSSSSTAVTSSSETTTSSSSAIVEVTTTSETATGSTATPSSTSATESSTSPLSSSETSSTTAAQATSGFTPTSTSSSTETTLSPTEPTSTPVAISGLLSNGTTPTVIPSSTSSAPSSTASLSFVGYIDNGKYGFLLSVPGNYSPFDADISRSDIEYILSDSFVDIDDIAADSSYYSLSTTQFDFTEQIADSQQIDAALLGTVAGLGQYSATVLLSPLQTGAKKVKRAATTITLVATLDVTSGFSSSTSSPSVSSTGITDTTGSSVSSSSSAPGSLASESAVVVVTSSVKSFHTVTYTTTTCSNHKCSAVPTSGVISTFTSTDTTGGIVTVLTTVPCSTSSIAPAAVAGETSESGGVTETAVPGVETYPGTSISYSGAGASGSSTTEGVFVSTYEGAAMKVSSAGLTLLALIAGICMI